MLGHNPGAGHPEHPGRLKAVLDALADAGLDGETRAANEAEVADLERIAVRQTDLRGHADARVEVHRLRAEEDLILARILDDGQDPLF